jgi:hypothetical protein
MQTNLFNTDNSSHDFKITDDTYYFDEKYGLTKEIKDQLDAVYPETYKGRKETISHLERLCAKYPAVPFFKNLLGITYKAAGWKMKAEETFKWTFKSHPEFLFARLNMATIYLENGKVKKVPQLLGKSFNLGDLYPERDEFHENEALSYLQVAISYFLAIDDIQSAQKRMEMMDEIDPGAPLTYDARQEIITYNIESTSARFAADEAKKITVQDRGYRTETQTNQKPQFTHPEVEQLYQFGFDIPEDIILELLELPNESLVRDLEMVIEDAINRYEFFKDEVNNSGWDDSKYSFSLHAVFLLAEIDSEKSLDTLFDLLRQGDEFLNFWYSYDLEIIFRFPVAKLAINRTEALKEFAKEPNNSAAARNIPVSALEIISSINPDRRDQVSDIFKDLLQFHLDRLNDETVIDSEFLSYLVWSCIDIGEEKLLPYIKSLFEKDLILESIVGTYTDVAESIKENTPYFESFHYSIMDHYDHLENISTGDREMYTEDEDIFDDNLFQSLFFDSFNDSFPEFYDDSLYDFDERQPVIPEHNPHKDVGRNDPCPCGSGKKFKKCCL